MVALGRRLFDLRTRQNKEHFVMTDDKTTLELDRYERDNLIALLKVIYGGYVGPLDTGDWCGQIYWKLTDGKGFDPSRHAPNLSPEHQIKSVHQFWEHMIKSKEGS